jgi:hypothetical protein
VRLKEMGVNRIAVAPCVVGPETSPGALDASAIGAECAAPIGAHSNVAKLTAIAYGYVLSQLELPEEEG